MVRTEAVPSRVGSAASVSRVAQLRELLGSARFARGCLVLVTLSAALITLPALGSGTQLDDHLFARFALDHLHGHAANTHAWWNMFDIYGRTDAREVSEHIAWGGLPWWTPPDAKLAFLRPLATATHFLDYWLWPDQPFWMHAQNTLWYALCALLVARLYYRVLPPLPAALAALLFALDDAHVQGTSWIAARNTLLTTVFVLSTVLAWDRARRLRSRGYVLLAVASLLCAHASSEGGVAAWCYLLGYELLFVGRTTETSWARCRAILPLAAASLVWLLGSTLAGFGVRGHEGYIDPRATPLLFVRMALTRFPQWLSECLLLPRILTEQLPEALQVSVVAASYVVLVVLGLLAWPLVRRAAGARMLAVGFLASCVLACSLDVNPRLLFIPSIGAHGLVASLIVACFAEARRPRLGQWLLAVVGVLLAVVHVPLSVAAQPRSLLLMPWLEMHVQGLARDMLQVSARQRMFVLNAPNMLATSVAGGYVTAASGGARSVHVLGSHAQPVKLRRPARDTLVLEPSGGYLSALRGSALREAHRDFRAGQVITTRLWTVTIEAATADARPARVRFDVADAEAAHIAWVSWNPERARYEQTKLPPVGGATWLPGLKPAEAWSRETLMAAFE
jgi:hypothetical protein